MRRLITIILLSFVMAQIGYSQLPIDAQRLEDAIKAQIDTANVDPIEGIYKSIKGPHTAYYRLGIYKSKDSNLYKAVIIDTENKMWKLGETKAYFEPIGDKIYSVKWYMSNKNVADVFGGFNDKGFLEVLTTMAYTGEDAKLVKLYPPANRIPDVFRAPSNIPRNADNKQDNSPIASGTGFLISENGHIATNAHVIDGANAITVDFIDEEEMVHQYKAKIVKVDSANDVAVIKIDDDKFVSLDGLPYSIESRINIGASVYTIGFPLNSVMGTNFKVSDGIVSAKTGINDDVRYYQISVPIQPGNSGGPLFNKNGNVVGLTTARLSSEYVGTRVENVNYAIKSMYLLNLIDMIPNFGSLPEESKLLEKSLEEQVETLKQYVCLIRIY